MPEHTLEVPAGHERLWEEAQQRANLDGRTLPELVTAAVGAYLALRRPAIASASPGWEIEYHTSLAFDERYGDVVEVPSGYATFRCTCRTKIHDRTRVVIRLAADHVATDHPDWEPIPVPPDTQPAPAEGPQP
jgi:hypothetical protein